MNDVITVGDGWGSLEDIPVRKLNALQRQFLVPDYQRGYRWGKPEVTQLLEDIRVSTEKRYYLQPVVVKPMNGEWELVDGQQRLTTLFLITKWLQDHGHLESGPTYTIRYATRERSEAYLRAPTLDEADSNIDFDHIFEAFTAIDEWARDHPSDLESLAADLEEKVRLLWFEAPDHVSGEEMFKRLNSGKIPLTDAELVKALLVSLVERPSEFAAQWDAFERDLQNPEVWAFVAGGRLVASHIELLLDALADEYHKPATPRAPFHTFNAIRVRIEESDSPDAEARTVWDQVVRLHSRVLAWFEDQDFYHQVGYLIATSKRTCGKLIAESHDMARPQLALHLHQLIRETLPDWWEDLLGLSYENPSHRREQEKALLLMNVETVRRAKRQRFPFSEHQVVNRKRVWSLEHIHAQHAQPLGPDGRRTWLDEHRSVLKSMVGIDDNQKKVVLQRIEDQLDRTGERQTFDDLQRDVLLLMQPGEIDVDEAHSISNLALLDKNQNSSLGNSAYEVKRGKIIEMDKGGEYIPVCTRNVFLKYYTKESVPQLHYWSPADRKGYLDEMRSLLFPGEDHE